MKEAGRELEIQGKERESMNDQERVREMEAIRDQGGGREKKREGETRILSKREEKREEGREPY